MKIIALLSIFLALPSLGQLVIPPSTLPEMTNAYQIAIEGDTILSGPPSWVAQAGIIGKGFSLTPTITTYPQTITWAKLPTLPGFGPDPDQWIAKQIFSQQTLVVQAFTVLKAGATIAITVTVPALPSSIPTYTITCPNIAIPTPLPATITMTCTAVKQ